MLCSLRHFNEGESTIRKKENDTFYTGQQKQSTNSMNQQERMNMSNEKRSCQRRRRRRAAPSSLSRISRKSRMFSLVSVLLALFVPSHHLHYRLQECYAFTANPDHYHQQPSSRSQVMTRKRDYYQLATRRRQKKKGSSTSIQMASSMLQPQGRQPQQQPGQGLSPYFQAILSRTNERQRFVTGKYPVIVTIQECQTRKWLNLGRSDEKGGGATSLVLVNNTQIEKSLASFTRFQWLDETDRQQQQDGEVMSMELLAEIHTAKPGYLHIMPSDGAGSSAATLREAQYMTIPRWNQPQPKSITSALYEQLEDLKWKGPYRDRLWVSGFTLAGRKGILKSMDVNSGHITSVNSRSEAMALWPNEVHSVPTNLVQQQPTPTTTASGGETSTKTTKKKQSLDDAILVSDGFLVPGKDRGGIYIVQNPGNENSEWTICLTDRDDKNRWFYHRAVWIDLTGDGRQSILTARAKLRKVKTNNGRSEVVDSRPKNGQLVWLEMPKPHRFDEATGTPLEEDGTVFDPFSTRHVPWKERVLATGPDVMFNVADMDSTDDTIEVISSQFFDKKVTLHSIKIGPKPRISFSRVIDNRCGAAFGGTFADLDPSSRLEENYRQVIETGGSAGTVEPGSSFSHLLVTSHECNYVAVESETTSTTTTAAETTNGQHNDKNEPNGKSIAIDGGSLFSYRVPPGKESWKTEEWVRTTVATGFRVKSQLWNVINPGAPGFVYSFHAHKDDRKSGKRPLIAVAGDCAESAFIFRPDDDDDDDGEIKNEDSHAKYKLMSEIKCGATVGSIGIGYEDLCSDDVEQEPGYAKLYIPCYEKDKILVFALGSGEDAAIDYIDDDGW